MTSASFRPLSPVLRSVSRCFGLGLGILGLVAFAASCSSTKGAASSTVDAEAEVAWLEASPSLARSIELRSVEVSQMSNVDDFVRLSDWFQSTGEPTYPKLLEMAGSSDDSQRTFALSVIAARRDPRLLSPLRNRVPMSSLANQQHRYGMARALLMMGDRQGVPVLIDGLESASRRDRALCIAALNAGTNAGIAYNSAASAEERQVAVAAWRQWYADISDDVLLAR